MTTYFRLFKVTLLIIFELFSLSSLFSILLVITTASGIRAQLKQVAQADVDGGAKIIGPYT